MISLIYAVVAFGILIFFHELGHFLMAKASGVRVLTFALGFGTKLFKKTWRGTEYAICAVPLGGYVKMIGEDPEEDVDPKDQSHAFSTQPVGKRFLIVLAGPVFNLFLAVGLIWLLYWGEVPYLTTEIQDVLDGYPAAEAGIKPGDRIVAIDGDPVQSWQQVLEKVMTSDGKVMDLALERDGSVYQVTIHPQPRTVVSRYGDKIQLWQIGITSAGVLATHRFGPWSALIESIKWTWDKSWFTLRTLGRLLQGKESIRNIGSPLLIGMEAGKQAQLGASSYFSFIAFISVILAIMNLLPIPVLDGGHLLFFSIEGIARKPVSRRIRGAAQYVGVGVLACIMVWAIYRDLDRLIYWKTKQTEPPVVQEQSGPSELGRSHEDIGP
jgi:regulator of sigma E protease